MPVQSCAVCKTAFESFGRGRYCTRACQVRAYRKRRRGRMGSRPCDQCGEPHIIDPPGKRYCTERCAKAHSNAQQAARRSAAQIAPADLQPPPKPAPVDKAKEDAEGQRIQREYLKLRLGAGWSPDDHDWRR